MLCTQHLEGRVIGCKTHPKLRLLAPFRKRGGVFLFCDSVYPESIAWSILRSVHVSFSMR